MVKKYIKKENVNETIRHLNNNTSDVSNLLDQAKVDIDKLLNDIFGIEPSMKYIYEKNDTVLKGKDDIQNKSFHYFKNNNNEKTIIN